MKNKIIGTYFSDNTIDLGAIYVIDKLDIIEGKISNLIEYSLDNVRYFKSKIINNSFNNLVARYIKIDGIAKICMYQGVGYIGKYNDKWTNVFRQDQYWVGGDGLFSFNLTGNDDYNAKENDKTICVFGDTFACTLGKDNRRLNTLAMPNNSYCILDSINVDKVKPTFHINEDEYGHCIAYIIPTNNLAFEGTMASNLVDYNPENNQNYLSGYNPKKDIVLNFDLYSKHYVSHIIVSNYFEESDIDLNYQNRGIKNILIYLDNVYYKDPIIQKASYKDSGNNKTKIIIDKKVRKITFVIKNELNVGNYGGTNNKEPFFGIKKVYFYKNDDYYYQYVKATTNSEFLKKEKHSWFWLQDGVIIKNNFYSLPYVASSDESQPEGFKFKIDGISLIKCKIKNNEIDFTHNKQTITNLYRKDDTYTYNFGCGMLNNYVNDGYVYIYGFKTKKFDFENGNGLIVARVKPKDFEDLNKWKYFDGNNFVDDMTKSKIIINHVSTELSVHKDENDYMLVFTYDVQSRYVCYSLSNTPYGPFDNTRVAYVCKEDLCPHMYIYNAKAHPHLSKHGNILVSYNINTSDFDENIKYGKTYGPRFINLIKGGNENEI